MIYNQDVKNISWFFIFILVIILIMIGFSIKNKKETHSTVTIDGHSFNVEVATSEIQREKGLMNRTSLDTNAGMLFVFDKPDIYTFWMKNTKIPLDIIYINDSKIVEITTLDAETLDNTPQYTPKNKADKVLEINAKEAVNYGFKLGDLVEIN